MSQRRRSVSRAVLLLILLWDAISSTAELFFKMGAVATHVHEVTLANISVFLPRLLGHPFPWLGVGCYLLSFVLWATVLARVDLSVAYPLGGLSYLLVALLSVFILHEHPPVLRWVGISLIVGGIGLIAQSTARTHDAVSPVPAHPR